MNTAPTIRQATPSDHSKIKEVIDLSFPRFFRYFASHSVDSKTGTVLVSENEGSVAGFAKLTQFTIAGDKFGCILWLATHPDFRKTGVATQLVQAGKDYLKSQEAKAVFASAQRSNAGSLASFGRAGFGRVGFLGLWSVFGWRVFSFYRKIWFAPGEVVLMRSFVD